MATPQVAATASVRPLALSWLSTANVSCRSEELLDALWPDTIVTESSIQRAVSLARGARWAHAGPGLIQTFPTPGLSLRRRAFARHEPKRRTCPASRPRYAQSGDAAHRVHDARRRRNDDIVIVNGWILPMRAMFQTPRVPERLLSRSCRRNRTRHHCSTSAEPDYRTE